MITIKYFARLSDSLGIRSEKLAHHSQINTAEDVIQQLVERGGIWQDEFCGDHKILLAINQQMSERQATVADGDEIAFFPPVTGG